MKRINKFDKLLLDMDISKLKFCRRYKVNRSRIVQMKEGGEVSEKYKNRLMTALLDLQTLLDNKIEELSSK